MKKAEQFIWSQRDQDTGFWPRDEVANAVLGVGVRQVTLSGGVHAQLASNESAIISQNMERILTSFLMELIKSVAKEDEDSKEALETLENMEDQYILTLVGALKMTCEADPQNYLGYDLLEILWQRLLEQYEALDGQFKTVTPPLSYPSTGNAQTFIITTITTNFGPYL